MVKKFLQNKNISYQQTPKTAPTRSILPRSYVKKEPCANISYMCMQMKNKYEKNKMLSQQKQKVRSLTREYMKNKKELAINHVHRDWVNNAYRQ